MRPRLGPAEKAGYALGAFGGGLLNVMVATWLLFFYSPPADRGDPLLSVKVTALALTVGRVVDALADPVVGYASDHIRSRWGRRLPLVTGGSIPLVLVFFLIWHPPEGVGAVYVCTVLGAFFFLYTVVMCPYSALLPEIASEVPERADIAGYQALAQMGAAAVVGVASGYLIESLGYGGTAAAVGVVSVPCFWVAAWSVRRHVVVERQRPYPLVRGLSQVLGNVPFRYYLVASAAVWTGLNLLATSLPFFITVVVGRARHELGVFMGANIGVSALSVPLVRNLCTVFGPTRVVRGACLGLGAVLPLLGLVGSELPGGEYLQAVLLMVLAAPFLAAVYIVPPVLLSDIVDGDRRRTGERKEATYFGFNGIVLKGSLAVGAYLVSVLFHTLGYDSWRPAGIRAAGPVAGGLALLAALLFSSYHRLGKEEEPT